jgi:hypothetical protein
MGKQTIGQHLTRTLRTMDCRGWMQGADLQPEKHILSYLQKLGRLEYMIIRGHKLKRQLQY